MKIKNLLKHRKWSKVQLLTDGGLIIKFEDKSHTYISSDLMKEIVYQFSELDINKDE